jgi:hypothetical protein
LSSAIDRCKKCLKGSPEYSLSCLATNVNLDPGLIICSRQFGGTGEFASDFKASYKPARS